ncbi:MAG TPA: GNAT family N-acetyltransferase [Xanthobacteraceae bacterium]|nr:GNAT family N-acetyltransferase [Xanthobacteraceae bacterium]
MSSSGAVDSAARAPSTARTRIDAPPLAPGEDAHAPAAPTSLVAEWKPLAEFDAADIDAWHGLVARVLEPNVFLEPSFALAAAKYLPQGHGVGAILVRAGSRLMGLVPGRVEGLSAGRPISTFIGWTHPYAPLSVPLLDRGTAKDVVGCVLAALPKLPGAPRLILYPFVNEDGAVARLRAGELARKGISITCFDPHERAMLRPVAAARALAAVSGGRLKELRRQRRRLGELGMLARKSIARGAEIGAAIEAYLALEARGWKGREGGAAQSSDATRAFFKTAVAALAAEGKARIDLLVLDSNPIAAAITLFSGDRAWFWKTAYDENYARFSPGVQLALDLTEELGRDLSISLVDSCATADHPMIDHLWEGRLAIADWMMPLGNTGSAEVAVATAAETLRRAAIKGLRAVRKIARR